MGQGKGTPLYHYCGESNGHKGGKEKVGQPKNHLRSSPPLNSFRRRVSTKRVNRAECRELKKPPLENKKNAKKTADFKGKRYTLGEVL